MTDENWMRLAQQRALALVEEEDRNTHLRAALLKIAIHGHLEEEETDCDDCATAMQTLAFEALA